MPLARVALEDLGRPVLRAVVRRDDEVDAGVQVKRDLRIDDVRLVANEERHDELHRSRRLERSSVPQRELRSARRSRRGERRPGSRASREAEAATRTSGSRATSRRDRAPASGRGRTAYLAPCRCTAAPRSDPGGREATARRARRRARRGRDGTGESREEHEVGFGDGGRDGVPDIALVAVTLVVEAPEGEPHRRHTEDLARATVLGRAALVPPRLRSRTRLGGPSHRRARWTRDRSRAPSGARPDDPHAPTTPSPRRSRARRRRSGARRSRS